MDTMLAGLEFSTAYLDEILLKSENNEQNRKHIKAVFQKMDEYDFKLGSEKCEFFMKQIKILGQIIDENSRRSDTERTEVIKNMLSPNNVTNLQAWPTIIVSTFPKYLILELHWVTYWKRVVYGFYRKNAKPLSVSRFIVSSLWP